MSKEKKERDEQSMKDIRNQLEGKLCFALSDWRGRLSEKKFQKVVKKASKALAKNLISRRRKFKVPAKSRIEAKALAADN